MVRRNRSVREIIGMVVGQGWCRGRMFPTLVHSLRHGPLCKAVAGSTGQALAGLGCRAAKIGRWGPAQSLRHRNKHNRLSDWRLSNRPQRGKGATPRSPKGPSFPDAAAADSACLSSAPTSSGRLRFRPICPARPRGGDGDGGGGSGSGWVWECRLVGRYEEDVVVLGC